MSPPTFTQPTTPKEDPPNANQDEKKFGCRLKAVMISSIPTGIRNAVVDKRSWLGVVKDLAGKLREKRP